MATHNSIRFINLNWHFYAMLHKNQWNENEHYSRLNHQRWDMWDALTDDEQKYVRVNEDDYKCEGCHLCKELGIQ